MELVKWAFVREDWNNANIRPQKNARLETAATKQMFRESFAGRHCLVLADSFFEWKTIGTRKQPYRIMLKSGEPFAMAGIYARGETENSPVTFAILTTTANEIMQPIHERMPVIPPLGREKSWLPPGGVPFFNPFPSELMTAYPVTPKMNRTTFNDPEAIAPLETAVQ